MPIWIEAAFYIAVLALLSGIYVPRQHQWHRFDVVI
jgi:hypothetical protein